MGFKYAVLGAGRQGTACAYDLIRFGEADSVLLADQSLDAARAAAARVNRLLATDRAHAARLDVTDPGAVVQALTGIDAFLSAVPYSLNLGITQGGRCRPGRQLSAIWGATPTLGDLDRLARDEERPHLQQTEPGRTLRLERERELDLDRQAERRLAGGEQRLDRRHERQLAVHERRREIEDARSLPAQARPEAVGRRIVGRAGITQGAVGLRLGQPTRTRNSASDIGS